MRILAAPAVRSAVLSLATLVSLTLPSPAMAQRQLSWDALEVAARLDASGVLDVVERQTMVFSGDWNGGERTFNIRPRQRLEFVGMERIPDGGAPVGLTEDQSLDDMDEYAFTDSKTLRWRSRMPSDPPFSNTRFTYALHYRLSGILRRNGDQYVLDHDFAFADRVGDIQRFTLHLSLDPAWQTVTLFNDSYTAGPIRPGRSFVLTIPLRYAGADVPAFLDLSRPREVVWAVLAILGGLVVAVLALVVREVRLGRFEPVSDPNVNAGWIQQHILGHRAELVGAAWDGDVGKDEVSAIIARLVSEGKLSSDVTAPGSNLSLQLRVNRDSLDDYERTLIDGLFFDNHSTTSTDAVKRHYENTGYDPARAIAPQVQERVKALLPPGDNPRIWPWPSLALFLVGAWLLGTTWYSQGNDNPAPFIVGFAAVFIAAIAQIPGSVFRQRIDWGFKALANCLILPVLVALGVAGLLWYVVGTGEMEWPATLVGAVTALTLWIVWSAVNGLKSQNHRQATAFRKMLAKGRQYFKSELDKESPALRDDWYPWIAAFGLTNEVSRWAVQHPSGESSTVLHGTSTSSSFGSVSSSAPAWTGAAGGRSGGAGASASWAAAVGTMASGVASPSSSSSGGGGGGSSSGGSSGGGGGGGW